MSNEGAGEEFAHGTRQGGAPESPVVGLSKDGPVRSSHHARRRSEPRRRHSERRELSQKVRSLQKQNVGFMLGSLLLVAIAIGVSIVALDERGRVGDRLDEKDDALARAESRMGDLEREFTKTRKALGVARGEIKELVRLRIPSLYALEFGRALPVGSHHVRSITFETTDSAAKSDYEYDAVLENLSRAPVELMMSVLLFDELGVQVGRSQITAGAASSNPDVSERARMLQPGEARVYSGVIELDLGRAPAYFVVGSGERGPRRGS